MGKLKIPMGRSFSVAVMNEDEYDKARMIFASNGIKWDSGREMMSPERGWEPRYGALDYNGCGITRGSKPYFSTILDFFEFEQTYGELEPTYGELEPMEADIGALFV